MDFFKRFTNKSDVKKVYKYKMRAECSQDVVNFINHAHNILGSFIMTKVDGYPDVDFYFETVMPIEEVIFELKRLKDTHVMYQTLNYSDKYTGERNYKII